MRVRPFFVSVFAHAKWSYDHGSAGAGLGPATLGRLSPTGRSELDNSRSFSDAPRSGVLSAVPREAGQDSQNAVAHSAAPPLFGYAAHGRNFYFSPVYEGMVCFISS